MDELCQELRNSTVDLAVTDWPEAYDCAQQDSDANKIRADILVKQDFPSEGGPFNYAQDYVIAVRKGDEHLLWTINQSNNEFAAKRSAFRLASSAESRAHECPKN